MFEFLAALAIMSALVAMMIGVVTIDKKSPGGSQSRPSGRHRSGKRAPRSRAANGKHKGSRGRR